MQHARICECRGASHGDYPPVKQAGRFRPAGQAAAAPTPFDAAMAIVGLVLGFGRIVLVDLTGGSGLFLIRESSRPSDVLRLAVELPLSSVGIRRRPLAVAAIVTQLTIFNCVGYGGAGASGAGASVALAGGGPDLWSARCRQPGVGNLPMIVASLGLCGGQIYLADSAGHGRRHWLVLAAAPLRCRVRAGLLREGNAGRPPANTLAAWPQSRPRRSSPPAQRRRWR